MLLLTVVPTAADPGGQASMLESVLTVGGFVLAILLIVGLQLRTYARRRRGEEAGTHDARGSEVMLGPWHT